MKRRTPWAFAAIAFVLAWACRSKESVVRFPSAPVIIISIDTLRADHLPAYGYRGVETPNIDALRADGLLFSNAYAHVPLTLPSHVTLLTGTLPGANGVRNNIGYRFDGDAGPTLPGLLRASGYKTGAAVSAYVLRSSAGLASLFDFYEDRIASRAGTPVGALQRDGDQTRQVLEQWMSTLGEGPFFTLLHLFEPHTPYTPGEPWASRYPVPYDGEIAAADEIVGRFLATLKQKGLYDRSLIVLLSDHGEGLGTHGEPEHGLFLYRETIHVPLIIKLPGSARRGETISNPVGLIDVAPTILNVVGLEPSAGMTGIDILAAPTENVRTRRIFSETFYPRIHLGWSELRSLVDDRFHYIEGPDPELYANTDPGETRNVLRDERRVYAAMSDAMAPYRKAAEIPVKVDPEEARKLAALGYLGSVAPKTTGPLPDPKARVGVIAVMSEAMHLVSLGRDDEAVPRLRMITEREPGMTDAWNQLALSLETLGRYEEAAEAYRKAIELTPELAGEFGLSLGSILLRLDRFDEAEKHAALAQKLNPSGYHVLRARVAFARKDWVAVEREARAAMNEQYGRMAASVILAQAYAHQGRIEAGLELVDAAERETREHNLGAIETLEYARGDLFARADRLVEAEAAFRREIASFPRGRLPYSALAILYRMRNDENAMHAVIEDMAKANPTKRTYLYAAHTLEELKDPNGAAAWRKRAAVAK